MDLDELERLLKAATAGPWSSTPSIPEQGYECFWITACPEINQEREVAVVTGPQNARNTANAALIAALRNNAEELIRDARRWRELALLMSDPEADLHVNSAAWHLIVDGVDCAIAQKAKPS